MLPADYRERLPDALEQVRRSLVPVSNPECFEQLGEFAVWAEMFGLVSLPTDERERGRKVAVLCRMYWETLGDLPADLLALALKRCRAGHGFSKLPLPADIRGYVGQELARRQLMAMRLDTAMRFATFAEPPLSDRERITDEQRAEVAATVEKCGAALFDLVERVNLGDGEAVGRKGKGKGDPWFTHNEHPVGPVGAEQVRKPAVGFSAAEMQESFDALKAEGRTLIPRPAPAEAEDVAETGGAA